MPFEVLSALMWIARIFWGLHLHDESYVLFVQLVQGKKEHGGIWLQCGTHAFFILAHVNNWLGGSLMSPTVSL